MCIFTKGVAYIHFLQAEAHLGVYIPIYTMANGPIRSLENYFVYFKQYKKEINSLT